MAKVTGRRLNRALNLGAAHALYRKDGRWYHLLRNFPGVLFDERGYVLFATEQEYKRCPYLTHGAELHVPKGIAAIPDYVKLDRPASTYC